MIDGGDIEPILKRLAEWQSDCRRRYDQHEDNARVMILSIALHHAIVALHYSYDDSGDRYYLSVLKNVFSILERNP